MLDSVDSVDVYQILMLDSVDVKNQILMLDFADVKIQILMLDYVDVNQIRFC